MKYQETSEDDNFITAINFYKDGNLEGATKYLRKILKSASPLWRAKAYHGLATFEERKKM